MPINGMSLSKASTGETLARPYLEVKYVNPHTDKSVNVVALVDTGADRCVLPADFAVILGHDLEKGKKTTILTASGPDTCYQHTMLIEIAGFKSQEISVLFASGTKSPLLGVSTFLINFTLTIDYPNLNFSLKLPDKPEETLSAWDTP